MAEEREGVGFVEVWVISLDEEGWVGAWGTGEAWERGWGGVKAGGWKTLSAGGKRREQVVEILLLPWEEGWE